MHHGAGQSPPLPLVDVLRVIIAAPTGRAPAVNLAEPSRVALLSTSTTNDTDQSNEQCDATPTRWERVLTAG